MNIDDALGKLVELAPLTKFEKMMGICSMLSQLLDEHRIMPIIVGGFAVEIYTRSEYTTSDIDLVLVRRDLADEYLTRLGFSKEGRHWYHENLGVSIEIPSDVLRSADSDRIVKIHLPDGGFVYVIGLEDIILDRLRACVHWQSTSDCEWGARMLLLHRERLDIRYMKGISQEDGTIDVLQQWLVDINGSGM